MNQLYSLISNHCHLDPAELKICYGGQMCPRSDVTLLEDADMYNDCTLVALCRVSGGGCNFTELLSKCEDCKDPGGCVFNQDGIAFGYGYHELVNKEMWKAITSQRTEAYSVIGTLFGLGYSQKVKVREMSEEPSTRLADVLHLLYHEDKYLTWERIIQLLTHEEHSDLAQVISNSIP